MEYYFIVNIFLIVSVLLLFSFASDLHATQTLHNLRAQKQSDKNIMRNLRLIENL